MEVKKQITEKIKKIAIFRALQLGDMLCIVPTLRAIRNYYPKATITLIGLPWAREFAERFSFYIDNFITFPGFPSLPEQRVNREAFPTFLQKLQKENYDLILQLHGSGTITNPLISLLGGKRAAGFYLKNNFQPNYSTFYLYPTDLHEIRKYLFLLSCLGIPSQGDYLEFPLTKEDDESSKHLMNSHKIENQKYIVLHPGARDTRRQNDIHLFSKIARHINSKGVRIVLTGTKDERDLCREVINHLALKNCINLAGETTLGQLAYLIKHSLLLISNDTGVSHLSAALQTKSIVLFTKNSNPLIWAPLNTAQHISVIPPHSSKGICSITDNILYSTTNKQTISQKEVYAN